VDIIIGEARRHWSADDKRAIVAETFMDGETVARVARRHELNPSMLFAWRKQYREVADLVVSPEPIGFAPVVIAPAERNEPACRNEAPSKHHPVVELDFESGARLRIFGAADTGLVKAVVEALTRR